jgi:hypothetical protein
MQTAKCFDLYTPDGTLIFRVYFTEREFPPTKQPDPAPKPPEPATAPLIDKTRGGSNGDRMTSPQRRKLFRVLAMKGIEGEKAHEELKKLFRSASLDLVGKAEASQMIDHLVREDKGGNGHGPSL